MNSQRSKGQENEKVNQNLQHAFRGKVTTVNVQIKQGERSQIDKLTLQLKELEKGLTEPTGGKEHGL